MIVASISIWMKPLRVAALGAFALLAAPGPAPAETIVDLELVLAVDASRSMDPLEQLIQRKGYAEAFRSHEVISAILAGGSGSLAVVYLEWAGATIQSVIVPWTLIDSEQASRDFADAIERHEPERLSRTSISGALLVAGELFGQSGWRGVRRIIDVSGDGPNNQGVPVELARDQVLAKGIVINGLPLVMRPTLSGFGIANLDEYYADCVIGGAGSFVIPVNDWDRFGEAVRRKLVLEISGIFPEPRVMLAAQSGGALGLPKGRDKVDCLTGERLWEKRMLDMEWR